MTCATVEGHVLPEREETHHVFEKTFGLGRVGWPRSFGPGGVEDLRSETCARSSCPPPPKEVGHPVAETVGLGRWFVHRSCLLGGAGGRHRNGLYLSGVPGERKPARAGDGHLQLPLRIVERRRRGESTGRFPANRQRRQREIGR